MVSGASSEGSADEGSGAGVSVGFAPSLLAPSSEADVGVGSALEVSVGREDSAAVIVGSSFAFPFPIPKPADSPKVSPILSRRPAILENNKNGRTPGSTKRKYREGERR